MTNYRVLSARLGIAQGSVVSGSDLPEGCNILLLVDTGHLEVVRQDVPNIKPPVDPEPEPADMPEEQD